MRSLTRHVRRGLVALLFSLVLSPACADDDSGTDVHISTTAECSPAAGVAPLTVRCRPAFEGEGAAEDDSVEYEWLWGDEPDAEPETHPSPIHTYDAVGSYTILLTARHVDSGATATFETVIDVVGAPNLQATGVVHHAEGPLNAGDALVVDFTIKNEGSSAAGESDACIMICGNTPCTRNTGTLLGTADVEPLEGGAEVHRLGSSGVLPPNVAGGNYFVAICADCGDDIEELSEDDNCAEAPDILTVVQTEEFPELTVDQLAFTPRWVFEGADLKVLLSFRNDGERAASLLAWQVWFVPGAGVTSTDPEEGIHPHLPGQIAAIPSRTSIEVAFEVSLKGSDDNGEPLFPTGEYTLCAKIDSDDTILEINDLNNIRCSETPVKVIAKVVDGVDLLVTSMIYEPDAVPLDGRINVEAVVCNRGRVRALQHTTGVVFSPTMDYDDPGAVAVMGFNPAEINAQVCKRLNGQGPVPPSIIEPGQWFVCMKADGPNVIQEVDENNNIFCDPQAIFVGGTQQVDLEVGGIEFGPILEEKHECGRPIDVSLTLRNNQPNRASAFVARIYLSEDDVIERTDLQIHQELLGSLNGNEERVLPLSVTIPVDTPEQVPRWHIGAIVDPDDEVEELDESNNRGLAEGTLALTNCLGGCGDDGFEPNDTAEGAARVMPGVQERLCIGPDTGEDWFGIPLLAGESLTVTIGFDQQLGDLDLELYDASVVNLLARSATGANQEEVRVALATVPSIYFVRVSASRREIENRYNLSVVVRPPLEGVDVAPAAFSATPRTVILGQAIHVELDVVNIGLDPAGAHAVEVRSRTHTPPGEEEPAEETVLATAELDGVPALGSQHLALDVLLPPATPAGDHDIVVVVDPGAAINEVDEGNNRAVSLPITLVVPGQECLDAEDASEPNNSEASAMPPPDVPEVNAGLVRTDGLTVCYGFDDWWEIPLEEGDSLRVRTTFNHARADLDLAIHLPEGPPLWSRGRRNFEDLEVQNAQEGLHYVQVNFFSPGDQDWANYRMELEVTRCSPDRFEPNGSCENATPLPPDGLVGLSLCGGDEDIYALDLFSGFPVTICAVPETGDLASMILTLSRGDDCGFIRTANGCLQYDPRISDTYQVFVSDRNGRLREYDLEIQGLNGANIAVTELAVDPAVAAPGARPLVSGVIRNTLVQPVGAFDYEIRLSEDQVIDDDDALLWGGRQADGLDRGERIDVSRRPVVPDLPAGDYFVGLSVHLDDQAPEADRAPNDNLLVVPFEIVAACEPDLRDPGDDIAPGMLAAPGLHRGTLCERDLADWYVVDLEDGESVTATLTFDEDEGDLDLFLHPANDPDESISESVGPGDVEVVSAENPGEGMYLIEVVSFEAGHHNAYNLDIDVED